MCGRMGASPYRGENWLMACMSSRLGVCPSVLSLHHPSHHLIISSGPPARPACLRRDGMLAHAHLLGQLIAFSTGTRFGSPSFRTWARLGGSWTAWLAWALEPHRAKGSCKTSAGRRAAGQLASEGQGLNVCVCVCTRYICRYVQ